MSVRQSPRPFTLLLALCLVSVVVLSCASVEAGRRYALVVGVKTYRPNQNLPPLPYTENDANELAAVLKDGGYQVTVMTQTLGRTEGQDVLNPLSDYIRDQLDALIKTPFLGKDDVVLVALAGHGVQFDKIEKQPDGKEKKTPKFYFCPADAAISDVKTAADVTERNRLIDLDELYAALKSCKAGGKVLLVDACRNDPSGIRAKSVTRPRIADPPGGTVAFFSCSENEVAREDSDLKNGVFFHFVIEALKGAADSSTRTRPADRIITLSELEQHVSVSVYDFVRKKYQGTRQTPERKGDVRLTIPLIELPSANLVITNSIGMKLRLIRAGEFLMGSPADEEDRSDSEEQHRVRISDSFRMQTTEVTQGQWESVMGTAPWKGEALVKEGADYAASYVSWEDAVEFCRKLSTKEGVEYRLPTEAEWEYACRAGTSTMYGFGNSPGSLKDYGWFDENAFDVDEQYAHSVGLKRANLWGLYDMHGNVFEWCSDRYSEGYYKASPETDPTGPSSGSFRVSRGGSWFYSPQFCRSAYRFWYSPGGRSNSLGFRVLRSSVK